MAADENVLVDRELLEECGLLECPHQTQRRDCAGCTPIDPLPAVADMPVGRLVEAGDALEHGALAGTVRSDEPADLPFLDLERDLVERRQPTELLGDAVDLQQCRGTDHAFLRLPRSVRHSRMRLGRLSRPSGRNRTVAIRIAP